MPVRTAAETARQTAIAAERPLRALMTIFLLVPPVVFGLVAWTSYGGAFDDARERMDRTLDLVHEHAVKVFETHELVSDQVSEILQGLPDSEIRARETEIHLRLEKIVARLPQLNDIWVVGSDGHPLVTAKFHPVDPSVDLSDRGYFRAFADDLQETGTQYVSEMLSGRIDPTVRFFQISTRRNGPDGGFAGVVAISAEPSYFDRFYAAIAKGELDTVTLLREDGNVLSRHPLPSLETERSGPPTHFAEALASGFQSGYVEARSSIDGVERVYAYRKVPDLPVYVSVGLDSARIVSAWRRELISHLYYGLPATLALAGITLVAMRRTRREIEALETLQAEIRRREDAEAQFRQAQKMEAVGRLTGGIAHDFNNLIQISMGSLDLLSRRLRQNDPEHRRLLATAMDGMRRASTLTRRLLAFARKQPLDPRVTDVNRLVKDTADLVTGMLGETVAVETVLAGGLWTASIDPNELETALLNLAVNARDAMPDGGKLTIETGNAALDEAYAAEHADLAAGQFVQVSVTDTGAGMTPDIAAKVFEPFFTTKATGEGTGLGLSQVYGFVKQSGGHVKIYSEPGRGTTVKLYVPRYIGSEAPVERSHAAGPAPTARDGETILVVEDDPDVRAFAREALRSLGYLVLEADRAERALELLVAHPGVALLLTDIVMPGMGGKTLADAAGRLRPELPILFMTGYTRNAIVHNGTLDPGVHLISKPFTLEQIGRKARELLDAVAPPQADPPSAGNLASPRRRVLCVEDEPILAMAAEDMLAELGYAATVVASAEDAITTIDAGADFDVLVTDQSLPGMNGVELIAALRGRGLSLPAVLATGYDKPPAGALSGASYLPKPYDLKRLDEAVRNALSLSVNGGD